MLGWREQLLEWVEENGSEEAEPVCGSSESGGKVGTRGSSFVCLFSIFKGGGTQSVCMLRRKNDLAMGKNYFPSERGKDEKFLSGLCDSGH